MQVKKIISIIICFTLLLSTLTLSFVSVSAETSSDYKYTTKINNANVKSSSFSSKQSAIGYKTISGFIDVVNFGNEDYADLYNLSNTYLKLYIDSELFLGAQLDLTVSPKNDATSRVIHYNSDELKYTYQNNYFYITIDLSEFLGNIDISVSLTLANGQNISIEETVKLNMTSSASGNYGDEAAIVYKDNQDYINVAQLGNENYVGLYNLADTYLKLYLDSELLPGAQLDLTVKSQNTGTSKIIHYNSDELKYTYENRYFYISIDLSGFSGNIDVFVSLTLANGQKIKIYGAMRLHMTSNDSESYSELAKGICGENLSWVIDSENQLIISGKGKMYNFNRFASTDSEDSYVIPWKSYRNQIKTIIICNGVESIGNQAFYYKSPYSITQNDIDSVTSVTLPSTLTSIGNDAFVSCNSIDTIKIPESVSSIGDSAFMECTSLININLPSKLNSLSKHIFYHCSNLTSIKIPDSITQIGFESFIGSGLMSIVISKNVTEIGYGAFSYCENLGEATIEGNIKINGYLFYSDSNLRKVIFNGTIEETDETTGSIVGKNFYNCTSLVNIEVPSQFTYKNEKYPIQSFENFKGCEKINIENIVFNDDAVVQDGVVYTNDKKTLLWYPETLQTKSFSIPYGVEKLAWRSFYGQEMLEHITIPNSVKTLGGQVFSYCTNLDNVIIPDSISEVYDFQNCTSLKSIVIPSSVTTMYNNYKGSVETFANCKDLTIYCDKGSYVETFANNSTFATKQTVYCNFDAMGGTISNNRIAVIPNDKFWNMPIPIRDGYTFDGWYTSKEDGDKITSTSLVSKDSDFTLYAHWSIIQNKNLINCTLSLSQSSFIYDGNAKTPTITVEDGDITLVEDIDYTVMYSNNINVGNATVIAVGKGAYVGAISKNFKITESIVNNPNSSVTQPTQANNTKKPSVSSTTTTIATVSVKAPKLTAGKKLFKVKYTKVKNAVGFEVRYKIGKKTYIKTFNTKKSATKTIKGLKKGKYKVQIRAFSKGKKSYSNWSKAKTVKVK